MARLGRWRGPSRLQFPKDLKVELFPLHSPLLRESLLVSFPPLSYMLKFSGSSYLISGQRLNLGVGRPERPSPRGLSPSARSRARASQPESRVVGFQPAQREGRTGECRPEGHYHTALLVAAPEVLGASEPIAWAAFASLKPRDARRRGAQIPARAPGGGVRWKDTETSMPRKAPCAFKDLMIRLLQFTLRIAFRCVLHRRKSQDIRCRKL